MGRWNWICNFSGSHPAKKILKIVKSHPIWWQGRKTCSVWNWQAAAIHDVWNLWVEHLQLMYNPGLDITVDVCLVSFKGRCAFKQYMPNKPAKYSIKIWAACDARTSYAWNMQVYTGKPQDGQWEESRACVCGPWFDHWAPGTHNYLRQLLYVIFPWLGAPEKKWLVQ